MTEEWRPVVGYEGYYEVSDQGRVRSVDRVITSRNGRTSRYTGQVLSQKFQHHYMRVGLSKGSVGACWCVHRLVVEAFEQPKPSPQSVARHLNGDHLDNRAENLTWGTCRENTADMIRHGRAYWRNQTECVNGHEFTEANTRIDVTPTGGRRRNCRTCERIRSIPRNKKRDDERKAQRPIKACRVCSGLFQSSHKNAAFCSPECKKASRRVEFKSGRQYQTGRTA